MVTVFTVKLFDRHSQWSNENHSIEAWAVKITNTVSLSYVPLEGIADQMKNFKSSVWSHIWNTIFIYLFIFYWPAKKREMEKESLEENGVPTKATPTTSVFCQGRTVMGG